MEYKLPPISKEQQEVHDAINAGFNVKIDAVAGAGKSTLKYMIASLNPKLSFLDLTYNARLKLDGRTKVEQLELKNVDPHSYHSSVCAYYQPGVFTNAGILDVLGDPHSLANSGAKFDAIFLDEQQDMSPVLFRWSIKIIMEICVKNPIIIALGDCNQTLYTYDGADPLFIEMVDHIYNRICDRKWKQVDLRISYRVPSVIAEFINKRMLKQDRIKAHREGGKVEYLIDPGDPDFLNQLVDKFLAMGYKLGDIFILSGSIRHNRSLAIRANKMVAAGKLVHIPTDDQALNSKVIINKVVFGSYHQTKGLQNKVVILDKFDESYGNLTKQKCDICPNPLYVGASRAIDHLVLLHTAGKQPLPFLDMTGLGIEIPPKIYAPTITQRAKMSVTDLMRGHSSMFLYDLDKDHITIEEIESAPAKRIALRPEIKMKKDDVEYFETVSHLYGTAATLSAEFKTTKSCEVLKWLKVNLPKAPRIQEMDPGNLAAADFVRIANYLQSYSPNAAGYKHQLSQIRGYKWVEGEKFNTAVERLISKVGRDGRYEVATKYEHKMMTVVGFADIVKLDQLWEIKMVSAMTTEHRIQLCIYAAMLGGERTLYLYNPLMDKTWKVTLTNPAEFLDKIIVNRLKFNSTMTPDQFMEMIDECYSQYIEPTTRVDLSGLDI